jgi:adenylate cyclase class 2
MKEIEVKIFEIDEKRIISKLKKLGAKKIFEDEVRTMIFDTPKRSLIKNNLLLRLRVEGKEFVLGIKKKVPGNSLAKIRKEIEVKVDNLKDTELIINNLGFKKIYSSKKFRTSFILNGARIDLDRIPKIPTFMEIEASSVHLIEKIAKLLGYTMNETKNFSLKELIKYYSKKK